MKLDELEAVATKFAAEIDPQVSEKLEEVTIICCATVKDVETLMTSELDYDMANEGPLPSDMKGEFYGDPLEVEEDDDGTKEIVYDAEGEIFLVASNIANEEEAAKILMHEVGHALGLSEHDVAALGLGVTESPRDVINEPPKNG